MPKTASDWSAVKETLRRERHLHDLLARSGSARLHRRVTGPTEARASWRRCEREIVEVERSVRLLDVTGAAFWDEYRHGQDRLIKLFHDAGVYFAG